MNTLNKKQNRKLEDMNPLLNELLQQNLISKEESTNFMLDPRLSKPLQPSWEAVRSSFFREDAPNIEFEVEPMNSANLCPTFFWTLEASHKYRSRFNQDISIQKRQEKFKTVVQHTKVLISKQLKIHPKDLALVRNTSEGNNILSSGFKRWEGGEVLLWDENHPTNNGAWKLKKTPNKSIQYFSLKDIDFKQHDNKVQEQIIQNVLKEIRHNTVMLSFTLVSNISGIKMPAKAIVKAVRDYERLYFGRKRSQIHIHVDGAVAWGAINLDLTDMDCDSFASSAHKWYMGPFETGILYMKPDRVQDFNPSIYAYDGKVHIPDDFPSDISRFELLGQRDDANLYALYTNAQLHNCINRNAQGKPEPSRIQNRIFELQKYLLRKLTLLNSKPDFEVDLRSPSSTTFSNGVVIFQVKYRRQAINHALLYNELYKKTENSEKKRFAIAAAQNNHIRICPHIMNRTKNIDEVVDAIESFARKGFHNCEDSNQKMGYVYWPLNPYS